MKKLYIRYMNKADWLLSLVSWSELGGSWTLQYSSPSAIVRQTWMARWATLSNNYTFSNPSPGDVVVIKLGWNGGKRGYIPQQIVNLPSTALESRIWKHGRSTSLNLGPPMVWWRSHGSRKGRAKHKHVENEVDFLPEILAWRAAISRDSTMRFGALNSPCMTFPRII